jgi:CRISPR type III-associated protein (TIGR04423 family)
MRKNQQEVLEYINSLKGYQGYVQFSNREIEDVFENFEDISVESKGGFVYEAHFYNGTDSISIKQINDSWYVDETKDVQTVEEKDIQTYNAINNLKVKMAQIWKEKKDPLCADMEVLKLEKTVFAGFAQRSNP